MVGAWDVSRRESGPHCLCPLYTGGGRLQSWQVAVLGNLHDHAAHLPHQRSTQQHSEHSREYPVLTFAVVQHMLLRVL
jgi:hypothetical protein